MVSHKIGWVRNIQQGLMAFCCPFFFQDAMEVMGVVAVMVNLALLGSGGSIQRMFPNMTTAQTILLIVFLEVKKHSCYQIWWMIMHSIEQWKKEKRRGKEGTRRNTKTREAEKRKMERQEKDSKEMKGKGMKGKGKRRKRKDRSKRNKRTKRKREMERRKG